MILDHLIIDNIRSYGHAEVVIPRGISLFEGDIGSGKSTILMAIEFGLFGFGSQKADSLLAKKAESGRVELGFSVDGRKYEICRSLVRKNGRISHDQKKSWIKADGQKEPLSVSELKQRVLQILRFNEPAAATAESRIFRYAVFTPQESMKEILADPKRRLETIRRAFGMEDYSTATSNARELLQELRIKAKILGERSANIPELEEESRKAQANISRLRGEISEISAEQDRLRGDEAKASSEARRLQEKSGERARIEAQKRSAREAADAAKGRIAGIEDEIGHQRGEIARSDAELAELSKAERPDTADSVAELDSKIAKIQGMHEKLIQYETEGRSAAGDISRLRGQLGRGEGGGVIDRAKTDSALSELEEIQGGKRRLLEELGRRHQELVERKAGIQARKDRAEDEIGRLAELGSVCPTCEQEITEEHRSRLADKNRKEADGADEEIRYVTDTYFETDKGIKEARAEIDDLGRRINELRSRIPKIDELDSRSARLEAIEAEITRLRSEIPGWEPGGAPTRRLQDTKEGLVRYENAGRRIRQIAEARRRGEDRIRKGLNSIGEQRAVISDKERELSELAGAEALHEFGDLDGQIRKNESEAQSLRNRIRETAGRMATLKERAANEERRVERNGAEISRSKRWRRRLNEVTEYQEWIERFFVPTVSEIEKQVLLSTWQGFNETYRGWYSILIDDPTKDSSVDEEFTPIVNQDGFEQEIDYLSGGERTSIALAYRLTLNSLMRKDTELIKSGLLILDEPTDGFSKGQLEKVRGLLDELRSEQVVLVSHERELETYVDRVFLVSKESGTSKITESVPAG